MKMRLGIAVVSLMLCAWNSANPPARYTSGASLAASGIMLAASGMLIGCEVQNQAAAAQYYLFFDSATVPTDGTGGYDSSHTNGWKAFIYCSPTTPCSWGMNGSIIPQGGSGIVFVNGISWSNSSTFPTKTAGAADSVMACSLQP